MSQVLHYSMNLKDLKVKFIFRVSSNKTQSIYELLSAHPKFGPVVFVDSVETGIHRGTNWFLKPTNAVISKDDMWAVLYFDSEEDRTMFLLENSAELTELKK